MFRPCRAVPGVRHSCRTLGHFHNHRHTQCYEITKWREHNFVTAEMKISMTDRRWNTGLFEMVVRVIRWYSPDHLILQMQPHVISFYGVTSRIRFMFLLFPQVSRNWRYESEPPMKPSPLTCYTQFGINSIIVLMFAESQRVHIQSTYKVCKKNLECCSIKQKNTYTPISSVLCMTSC